MKKRNYTSKFLAVTVMVIMMLCAAPVMEHFGIDMGVSAHAAKSGYFTYSVSGGEATITKVDYNSGGNLTIPDTLGGYPVTDLGERAFDKCQINTLTIGKNLNNFWSDSFNMSFIAEFYVNSSNQWFSSDSAGALYNKNKTILYRYPANNERRTFTVPSTVQSIFPNAFRFAYMIDQIVLPDSITEIGFSAFSNCYSLGKINLPKNLKQIESNTFYDCLDLREIAIPDECTSIGEYAFFRCASLQMVTIPESVETIGQKAFDDCFSLEYVQLRNMDADIDEFAFCMARYAPKEGKLYDFQINWSNYNVYLAAGYEEESEKYSEAANNALEFYDGYTPYGTIYCYKGSTAETYAKNNGINYAYLSGNSADHTHSLTEIIIPSTCTEQGGRFVGCTQCDYIASYELYSLAPHTYKTKTTKATTSKNGKVVKACTVCGDVKSSKTIYKISSIKLSATSYTYNGKVKTPSVVIKDSKGNKLVKGTDYTVKYSSGRKAVGTYKVKITFMGKYSGTKTLSFKIVLGKVTGIKSVRSGSKTTISWNKVTGATGYVVYEYNKNTGKYKKLGTFKTNSIKNNYSGRNTALKIRAYYKAKDGTVHYGAYSAKTTVKI